MNTILEDAVQRITEVMGKRLLTVEAAAGYLGTETAVIMEIGQVGLVPTVVGKYIRPVDLAKFELGIPSEIPEKAVDRKDISALPSHHLDLEEYEVSKEEYSMGSMVGGSVFLNSTRGTWHLAYYVEEAGLKKRKVIRVASEEDGLRMKAQLNLGSIMPVVIPKDQGKHRLGDYIDEVYSRYISIDIENATKENYCHIIGVIKRYLGEKFVEDIKHSDIQDYFNNLLTKQGKPASKSLKAKTKSILSRVLKYAVNEDIILKDPMSVGIRIGKEKRTDPRDKLIELDVLKRIIVAVRQSPTFYPIVVALLGTGVRINELLALRWENISLTEKTITICEAAKRTKGTDGSYEVGDPKTVAGTRVIAIHDSLVDILKTLKTSSPYVFSKKDGGMRAYSGLRRSFDRFWEKKGLGTESITFHRFRHSFISYMDAIEVDNAVVQSLVGHAGNNVTDSVYKKISLERKRKAVDQYYIFMSDVFNAGFDDTLSEVLPETLS